MRKQWTREIEGDQIVWVQHFLDSEDFPAAYTIRLVRLSYRELA